MGGMTKLIYSGSLPDHFEFRMELMEDPRDFTKAASAFGNYEEGMQPDKDHLGIHLVALGDSETYGFNRNGDAFPKVACENYHHTFVKNGHVFRHHQNKDPKKALGGVVKSAFNDRMGRIELFVHANKEKCAAELEKLARDGEVPVSMACRVQYDRCSICNGMRKSAKDPNMCDHIRNDLGKVANDGRVTGTYNDEPNFFDISFVYRPADRIAWSLKTASDGALDSIKLAEESGLWTPDHIAMPSDHSQQKLELMKKMAEHEQLYLQLAEKDEQDMGYEDRRLWELRKSAAGDTFDGATLTELRSYEPADALYSMAHARTVMDPVTFCKYALGGEFEKMAEHLPGIIHQCHGVFTRLLKESRAAEICNDAYFDVDTRQFAYDRPAELARMLSDVRMESSFDKSAASHRAVTVTIDGIPVKIASPGELSNKKIDFAVANCLAEKYASYKLAAFQAMRMFYPDEDLDGQSALLAVQNMLERN